jgi:acetyltransferase-like isoleucine patch superfamily enzyme
MLHYYYRFLRWCPGALGLLLRQKLYKRLLGKCGNNVLFGRFVDFVHPHRISLGDRAIVSDNATLTASDYQGDNYTIVIDDDVFVGKATLLHARENTIIVKSGANIGSSCKIVANLPISVGKNVLLAAYCYIGENQAKKCNSAPKKELPFICQTKTVIEDGCWLGVRVEVLSGAHVGKDSIVGAHAVVAGEIPAWAIAVGRPAKVIRFRNI